MALRFLARLLAHLALLANFPCEVLEYLAPLALFELMPAGVLLNLREFSMSHAVQAQFEASRGATCPRLQDVPVK